MTLKRLILAAFLTLAAADSFAQSALTTMRLTFRCRPSVALSSAGQHVIYCDSDDNKLYISKGGAAFVELGTGGGGAGTVTSVGLIVPAEFTVSGSPVTTSGSITVAKATQIQGRVYAGPATGADAAPTFRLLVAGDIPTHAHAAADVTSGALTMARGGTGLSSLGSSNQVMGMNNAATGLEYKTLVPGANISIAHAANSVTITATAGGGSTLPAVDTTSIVEGSADPTKEIRFEVDGLTTATTRVITPPDSNFTMAATDLAQTFTVDQRMNANLGIGRAPTTGTRLDVSNAGELVVRVDNTAATGNSGLVIWTGDGTGSSRTAYLQHRASETVPKAWNVGLFGTFDYYIRDDTRAVNALTIASATGNVGVGGTPPAAAKMLLKQTATGEGFAVQAVTGTTDEARLYADGSIVALQSASVDPLTLWVNGAETTRVDSNGLLTNTGDILLTKGGAGTTGPSLYIESSSSGSVDSEVYFWAAGAGSSSSSQGPSFSMTGNSFSRRANERGTILFLSGNPATPTALDGSISFISQGSFIDFATVSPSGSKLRVNQTGITIGAGTTIIKHISATASLNYTALGANACEVLTVTVTGAADGDSVELGVPNALADVDGATERTTFFGWVSAADTVSVRRCNPTGAATADPAAATVRASVTKY